MAAPENYVDISEVARITTADAYQGGLSAFHSAQDAFDGPGLQKEMVSVEYSPTRTILISGRTIGGTIESIVPILRALNVRVATFVDAAIGNIPIDPRGPDGALPEVIYTLKEELVAIYDYDVPFDSLVRATSEVERTRILRRILGPYPDEGVTPHAVNPMYYTKYAKSSRTIDGAIRFYFDARVLDLYGIRTKVFTQYLQATRADTIVKHEVVWDIPTANVGGLHLPLLERHIEFAIEAPNPKVGMRVYRAIVPLINVNGVVTNLLGALRIENRCSKDFLVRAFARTIMEIAGYSKVSAAWTYSQAMMLTGHVTNTTTIRELHGKNFGHKDNSKGAGILSHVLGLALAGNEGNSNNVSYLMYTGAV